jgi:hypothetical protein
MKTIQIFDPAMCCSTGVCGPDVDPELVRMAGFLKELADAGVKVERHNLSQQPIAFAQHAEVKALLQGEGIEVLPLVFVDGELVLKGEYPTEEMRAQWLALAQD